MIPLIRIPARAALVAMAVPLLAGCGASYTLPPAPSPTEIPALEARVAAMPSDAEAALQLAQAYRAARRPADARPVLERLVEQQPTAGSAFLLGLTYEELEMWSDARRLYRAYIESGESATLRRELEARMPLLQRRELQASLRSALAREAELANTPPQPYTIAVFPFQFVGGDEQYQPLGRALAELLVTDLSQTERLQVLERSQVQLLLDEMRLGQSARVDAATAARTGRILGAERVVHGSIDGSEAAVQLETAIVRVTDASWPGEGQPQGGQLQLTESDPLRELVDMEKRLALRIYSSLGIQLTATERERITRQPTENILALVAFGRGLEAEDAGDYARAAEHFAESASIDPGFAAARVSADRASATAAAADVDTQQLAAEAEAESAPGETGVDDFFMPNPMTRDPAAEILRTEGVSSPTVLELIFRRGN